MPCGLLHPPRCPLPAARYLLRRISDSGKRSSIRLVRNVSAPNSACERWQSLLAGPGGTQPFAGSIAIRRKRAKSLSGRRPAPSATLAGIEAAPSGVWILSAFPAPLRFCELPVFHPRRPYVLRRHCRSDPSSSACARHGSTAPRKVGIGKVMPLRLVMENGARNRIGQLRPVHA